MKRRKLVGSTAVAVSLILLGAACSSSKSSSSSSSSSSSAAGSSASSGSSAAGSSAAAGGSGPCDAAVDTSSDSTNGTGAGQMAWDIACSASKPLKATGDAIKIGWMNPEGDPNGTFPEYTVAAKVAVDYVNNVLGGVGSDLKAGKPGRPIALDVCNEAISPSDSAKCANQLVSDKNFANISTINFFGNNWPILQGSGVPTFDLLPVTVADFTSAGVFGIGSGGGCVGAHPGIVDFTANTLKAKKIAIPWADTPPGVVCYYDLEKKPVDILAGRVPGPANAANKDPGITELGVPIKPAQPDITAQASQVLAYKPDAIIFSGQDSDCWSLVNTLTKLGWSNSQVPLVMSSSCVDTAKAKQAGDAVKGVYFLGIPPLSEPQNQPPGVLQNEAQLYSDQMTKAGGTASKDVSLSFAVQGFQGVIQMYQYLGMAAAANSGIASLTSDQVNTWMKATHNIHIFGGTPLGCADAFAPYTAVCSHNVSVMQWDGTTYKVVKSDFDPTYIIAGTKIDTGPPGAS